MSHKGPIRVEKWSSHYEKKHNSKLRKAFFFIMHISYEIDRAKFAPVVGIYARLRSLRRNRKSWDLASRQIV